MWHACSAGCARCESRPRPSTSSRDRCSAMRRLGQPRWRRPPHGGSGASGAMRGHCGRMRSACARGSPSVRTTGARTTPKSRGRMPSPDAVADTLRPSRRRDREGMPPHCAWRNDWRACAARASTRGAAIRVGRGNAARGDADGARAAGGACAARGQRSRRRAGTLPGESSSSSARSGRWAAWICKGVLAMQGRGLLTDRPLVRRAIGSSRGHLRMVASGRAT